MSKGKKWTEEEDKVLVKLIEKSPQNLSSAFLMASCKLERTKGACEFRWYQYLKHKDSQRTFITTSKRKSMINGKNYIEGRSKREPKNNKISVWKKLLNLLGL